MSPTIAEQVRSIIAVQLDIDVSQLHDDTDITADLNADSLAAVELLIAVEEAFRFEIPDRDALTLHRVGDVVRYLELRMSRT